jgi:ribonuclease J
MIKFHKNQLYFIPLGGCGIFGANFSLYGYAGKWIIVDCGMGFGDDTMPGVDIILPDLSFIKDIQDDIVAMVVTHGHEDHIGGIEHLWPKLKVPIYATPFTAGLLHKKLENVSWGNQVELKFLPDDDTVDLGTFKVTTIKMAHSIPEMRGLIIQSEAGRILHTGDWKLDPQPIAGDVTDESALKELSKDPILALVGDSTNAMVPGHSGSEHKVHDCMIELFSEFQNRIVVTLFSSNVARLVSIAKAAYANDRHVCLVGRSLWRIHDVAKQCGYLDSVQEFIEAEDAAYLPKEKVVYVCTGSQGEPRAAMARIANNDHRTVELDEGDVVMFSSRSIPGNEQSINRIKNRLLAKGVIVMTDHDADIHVSGHPYRDEIRTILDWVKPQYVLPVHGERMQMERHADLAEECGISAPVIPINGDVIAIDEDGLEKVGEVKNGMLALEGKRLVAIDHESILMRKRLMYHGTAVVTLVVDQSGALIADPKITALGLFDEDSHEDDEYILSAVQAVKKALENMPKNKRTVDYSMQETARIAARRYFESEFDRKPQTRVHLVRI